MSYVSTGANEVSGASAGGHVGSRQPSVTRSLAKRAQLDTDNESKEASICRSK